MKKTEEHKKRISEAMTGKPATKGFGGKKHSESSKFKMSQANYGKVRHCKVKDSDVPELVRLRQAGKTFVEIALLYGVSPATASHRVKFASEIKYRT